jgi:hypothetical protein
MILSYRHPTIKVYDNSKKWKEVISRVIEKNQGSFHHETVFHRSNGSPDMNGGHYWTIEKQSKKILDHISESMKRFSNHGTYFYDDICAEWVPDKS